MKGIFAGANGLANLDLCKLTIQAGEADEAPKLVISLFNK
jgi:hypothetical protein